MAGGGSEITSESPSWHKAVGIALALSSAVFIGTSFIIKKKGLIDSNSLVIDKAGKTVNNDKPQSDNHAYLKNKLWWTGMVLMLLGELLNLMAYSFSPAILVTPLGALSVVISAFFSSIFLKERLSFSGKIGCAQCLLGAVIVILHAPTTSDTSTIPEFVSFVIQPVFLVYAFIMFLGVGLLMFWAGPRFGHKSPLVYISICSITGSFVVVTTQGFGSAVVYTLANPQDNQFRHWPIYIMMAFIIASGVIQINYLNKSLNLFSTAVVTPIYYVMFTTSTLVCSGILLHVFTFSSGISFATLCVGFLVIVGGVALLFEYSLKLSKLAAMEEQKEQAERDVLLQTPDSATESPIIIVDVTTPKV